MVTFMTPCCRLHTTGGNETATSHQPQQALQAGAAAGRDGQARRAAGAVKGYNQQLLRGVNHLLRQDAPQELARLQAELPSKARSWGGGKDTVMQ